MSARNTYYLLATLLFIAAELLLSAPLKAQTDPFGVAYYDVDRLRDTLPSDFYNDADFTPSGRYGWNTARYTTQIRHIATVVDSLNLPIIALWGVENEAVTRDIAQATKGDYTYLHRTLNSFDGSDFALLYHADRFSPRSTEDHHKTLIIKGEIFRTSHPDKGEEVVLILSADPRHAAQWAEEARRESPRAKLIVMGQIDARDPRKLGLKNPFSEAERHGYGNTRTRRGWILRDRILTDTAWHTAKAGIYARPYLFDDKRSTPLSAFRGTTYTAGYSRSLPVFAGF